MFTHVFAELFGTGSYSPYHLEFLYTMEKVSEQAGKLLRAKGL
jgi:hypothetical protein